MKKLTFLFLVILLVSGCRKDEVANNEENDAPLYDGVSCSSNCYIVEGQVTVGQTGEPIPQLRLEFHRNTPLPTSIFPPLFPGETNHMVTDVTNQDGYYSFKIPIDYDSDNLNKLKVMYDAPGYVSKTYEPVEYLNLESDSVDVPQTFDFKLFRSAQLKVNITVLNSGYHMFYIGVDLQPEELTDGGYVFFDGQISDTTITFTVPSGLTNILEWDATGENDVNEEVSFSIPTGETDEINVEI